MGIESRREKERQIRHDDILAAARQLFAEKGIEETSMDDIARRAEFTKRTLYSYFKSKEQLILAAYTDSIETFLLVLTEAMDAEGTGFDQLYAFGETYFEYCSRYPGFESMHSYLDYTGVISEKTGDYFEKFVALNDRAIGRVRRAFFEGIADRSLSDDFNVDMILSQFLYSLRAIIHRALSPSYSFAKFDPKIYLSTFLNLFLCSIRGNNPVVMHHANRYVLPMF